MRNPSINFRISPYQLGRGLRYLREQDKFFKPSSPANIIKQVFFTAIANTTINRADAVPPEIMAEIYQLLAKKARPETNFETFLAENYKESEPKPTAREEQSIIKSVTDFSPPEDWLSKDD